jgi:hypothetical protein
MRQNRKIKSGTTALSVMVAAICMALAGGWAWAANPAVAAADASHLAKVAEAHEPADYAAGTGPAAIAVGDYNEDGIPDMAVANSNLFTNGKSSVSILLGKGDGTFRAAVNYAAGNTPRSVAAADFNGDGHLDLAVANQGSNNVSILLGNGDGTFAAPLSLRVPGAFFVAAGDFNGDGKLDLAIASFGEQLERGVISIALGNGDGTFQKPVFYQLGTSTKRTHMIAVADLNHDGHLDLVVANAGVLLYPGDVTVLLGNGDGTFGQPAIYSAGQDPFSVALGDYNDDGKLDLAVADESVNQLSILPGNGDGTFGAPTAFATGTLPFSVAAADFNGDGKLDLVTANENSNDATVLLGRGDGTFGAPISVPADQAPQFVAVADFNGDGAPDIAVANLTSNDVTVVLNHRRR